MRGICNALSTLAPSQRVRFHAPPDRLNLVTLGQRDKVYNRTCIRQEMFILREHRRTSLIFNEERIEMTFPCDRIEAHNCEIHASQCGTKIRLWIPLSSNVIVIRGYVRRYVYGLYDYYSWRNKPRAY